MEDKLKQIVETYFKGWFCLKCNTPYITQGSGKCECGGKLVHGEDVALKMLEQEIDRSFTEGYEECRKDIAVGVGLAKDTEIPKIVSKIAEQLVSEENTEKKTLRDIVDKNKELYEDIVNESAEIMDRFFPKGVCKERGKALVFNGELITYAMRRFEQEIDRCRLGEREILKGDFLREFTNYGHDTKVRFLKHIPESDEELISMILDFFDGKRFYIEDKLTSDETI